MRKAAYAIVSVFALLLFLPGYHHACAIRHTGKRMDTSNATTDSILNFWLDQHMVGNNCPVPHKLFVFAGDAAMDSIAAAKTLLCSPEMREPIQQEYYAGLTSRKFAANPYSVLLRMSGRSRTLPAWPVYQFLDLPQLIEVELVDSAWIIQFKPDGKIPFTAYDLKGNVIPLPELQMHPARIAAVYYASGPKGKRQENDYHLDSKGRLIPVSIKPFCSRTFFLVNEKMIRHWHHATPGLQDRLLREMNYMRLLTAWLDSEDGKRADAGRSRKQQLECWNREGNLSILEKFICCRRRISFDLHTGDCFTYLRSDLSLLQLAWRSQKNPVERFPSSERN